MDVAKYVTEVLALRKETGEGLMGCRKAIDAHPGDLDAAKEHLRCSGQAVVRRKGSKQPCGCVV